MLSIFPVLLPAARISPSSVSDGRPVAVGSLEGQAFGQQRQGQAMATVGKDWRQLGLSQPPSFHLLDH